MPLTHDQAVMLAELAASSRPHGARRWDRAETVAALRKVQHLHLADVALALIRCADDPTADSPFAITNTRSPHWRERGTDRPPTTDARICREHGVQFHGTTCPSCKADALEAEARPARQHPPREPKPSLRDLVRAATDPIQEDQ